jgi:hypothetical protein
MKGRTMIPAATLDLFAGMPVSDYAASVAWYEKLLGPAAFVPDDTEAVWELAEHCYLDPDGNEIGFGGAPL